MKITNNTPQNYINQSYANQTAKPTQTDTQKADATPDVKTDSINLSSTTRDLQKISVASQTDPEDRVKRVEELKAQVESNQYTVNAEEVAEKMLGNFLNEHG